MVGQGVAGTVTDAAGGIVEKTPLNKVSPCAHSFLDQSSAGTSRMPF